jgi:hypothetical protein
MATDSPVKEIKDIIKNTGSMGEKAILDHLEKEKSEMSKLTEDIQIMLNTCQEREANLDKDVIHMSQFLQSRVSSINVINNIKK